VNRKKYPRRPELAGILNINKASGMTSHDVVAELRRAARIRRVGHAGTLDPIATGVLLICLDQATRVSQYLMASDKVYRARIRLGQTTDTDDREGEITRQQPLPPGLDESAIQQALDAFVGHIDQIPPRYAAIKQKGVPLYKLARQGIEAQVESRPIVIHAIHLLKWQPPYLTLDVHCGPGTYIRSLARDLGERLGCGGHLANLTRLKSGQFTLEETTELDEALRCLRGGQKQDIASILWPPDAALSDMARLTADAKAETRLRHGQQISGPHPAPDETQPALRRIYALDGTFIAIAEYDESTELWQPTKVFDLRP